MAHIAPPPGFQILPFFPRRRSLFFTSPRPPVSMPVKPDKEGKLEAVKVRLRAEQVAREKAAVLRYRQLAEDEAEQPQRRTQATE